MSYVLMKIIINGESTELPEPTPLADALCHLGIALPARSALALNGRVISRSDFPQTFLQDGDELLLIRPTYGG